ncbi:unnamed protein product [Ectocarpus sp. 13 AM-2016]
MIHGGAFSFALVAMKGSFEPPRAQGLRHKVAYTVRGSCPSRRLRKTTEPFACFSCPMLIGHAC